MKNVDKDSVKSGKRVDKRNKSLKLISVTSAILFVVIVLAFNVVFDSLLGDKFRWDWSQTDMFSVGEITEQLLADLDKEVKIIGLYDKGSVPSFTDIEVLLDKYVALSGGKVSVSYINPTKTPSIIKEVDPDDILKPVANEFVVWCEETSKTKVLGMYDLYKVGYNQQTYQQEIQGVMAEQSLSGAIKYTVADETPIVYMIKGHGEADYTENFSQMVSLIQNNNFQVKDLDMLLTDEIPEDARLLIILNPTSDISTKDKELLDDYLKSGKSLLVMTEFGNSTFPKLNEVLVDYNISISNDRVRETDDERHLAGEPYAFVVDIPAGMLSEEAVASSTMLLNARPIVAINNTKEWIKVEPFMQTGPNAVIETNGDPDQSGSESVVSIGLACENSGFVDGVNVVDNTKVLVIGASGFMSDEMLTAFGTNVYNVYAFYSSLNWLVDLNSDDLLITAKELPSYTLTGGSNTTYWIATIICVVIIPLGLLIAALVVYRKRKNL